MVNYDDNPTISDSVVFDLVTRDASGANVDAYRVDRVVIYFLERTFWSRNDRVFSQEIGGQTYSSYFSGADPVAVFGTDDYPAYLSTDEDNAQVTHQPTDAAGAPQTGHFQLVWNPVLAREGDYFLCYTWTPIAGGDKITERIDFVLGGDTQQTTSLPSHITKADKYETLLERYLPEMFKSFLGNADDTPNVLDKLNKVIAAGFTGVENLANQIIDLPDANATHETILPYLARMLGAELRTQDVTLWRRQVKRAVPLYKKKGTVGGLTEALAQAQASLVKFTRHWQVVSPYTYQEAFRATAGQTTFTLSQQPVLPTTSLNFGVSRRLSAGATYSAVSHTLVTYTTVSSTSAATWVGPTLAAGDSLLLRYLVQAVPNSSAQDIETYTQGLPLADSRDDFTTTYPPKNWNVRLIAEDDALLPDVCPSLHPFYDPVVYGKVRTEFPYSENIYNMDEYSGSTRDSTAPCDIDKDFLDSCSCCMGSKFSVDVEVESLSNDRITEVEEVVKENVPFHASLHTINYTGAFNEFIPPPSEQIEILGRMEINQNVIFGQTSFNRVIVDGADDTFALKRDMLASATTVATASDGIGFNDAVVLSSADVRFDRLGITSDNLLEILSGPDAGNYSVVPPAPGQKNVIDLDVNVAGAIGWPLDAGEFPFRLSRLIHRDTTADIYQDDLFIFSDANVNFVDSGVSSAELGDSSWNIQVPSGPSAGVYPVERVRTDGTLELSGWSGTTTTPGLSYNLRSGSTVIKAGSTGLLTVVRRGRVEMDLVQEELGVIQGDYVLYFDYYKILSIIPREESATVDKIYIEGYDGGNTGGAADVKVYRRLAEAFGHLEIRGMVLTTGVANYETLLGIQNGENPVSVPLHNDDFKENYLVLIGSNYYQIDYWDNRDISLIGATLAWGIPDVTVATNGISYSLVHFEKTSPIVTEDETEFDRLDRSVDGVIVVETDSGAPMMGLRANVLNAVNQGRRDEITDAVGITEKIWIEVRHKDQE